MFAKWTEVNGIKCQGKTEARICKILLDLGLDVKRGTAVATSNGNYTPDFDCGEFYVEVKAMNSWLHAHGIVPLIENARNEKMAQKSNTQHLKMIEVNDFVKPVIVVVDLTHKKKAYMDMGLPNTPLQVICGMPDDIKRELNDKIEYDTPISSYTETSGC
jgi:hypothetical protein